MTDLATARDLSEKGELDAAYVIADRYLQINPNDIEAMTVMVYVLIRSHKHSVAYSMAKRITEMNPNGPSGWLNLGMIAAELWQINESIRCYKKGVKLVKSQTGEPEEERKSRLSMLYVNMGSVLVDSGRFKEGEEYCRLALENNPESIKGRANLGFCQLANRDWSGWENYGYSIGCEWRPRAQYNDEPPWKGEKGVIVVSGEQGLGDEVSFASIIPDLSKWAKENDSRIILECDKRLEGLFRRSFDVEVYGTRGAKQIAWNPTEVNYSIPIGQLGERFRLKDSDFPGTPYLKPDPDRVLQWKALFRSKKKPVIGIGWRGGIPKTGARFRQMTLDELLPVFKLIDAHWVSLQYKPAGKEIAAFKEKHSEIDLVEYPHGTLTQDYDDTVAMVAAMDQVVTMQSAVTHVAGGLGVPCLTFVTTNSQWRYGYATDFIWAKSVQLARQTTKGSWADTINGVSLADLKGISGAAKKAARKSKLRANGKGVRNARLGNNRQAENRPSA